MDSKTTTTTATDDTPEAMPLSATEKIDGDDANTTAAATVLPRIRRRGKPLPRANDAPLPSVRTDTLAESGIIYHVNSQRKTTEEAASTIVVEATTAGSMASAGVTVTRFASLSLTAVAEDRMEAFAPGRVVGKEVVRRISRGLNVLDLYCGTGGFAMNAAVGGARSVLGVRNMCVYLHTST